MVHEFFDRFLFEIVTTFIGLVILVLLTLIQRSARPNIRFHVYGDAQERRFLLRNFDSVNIQGPLTIEINAWGRITDNARVFAGPYAKKNEAVLSEDRRTATFELNSFPADGSIVVVVTTESPDVRLELTVFAKDKNHVVVRGGTIEAPTRWHHRGGALLRWFLGLGIGLIIMAWGYATFFRDKLDWDKDWRMDLFLLIALIMASIMNYFTIVQPMTQEEMIAGYLGRSDIGRTGQRPSDEAGAACAPPTASRGTSRRRGFLRRLRERVVRTRKRGRAIEAR